MHERQLSLVSFYGPKPARLQQIIEDLQTAIADRLGNLFTPRPMDEVHGTIIGLEGETLGTRIYNRTFSSLRRHVPIDLPGIVRDLRETPIIPFEVRFFGFSPNESTQIVSRGATAYLRSFSFQGEAAVIIGWPVDTTGSPTDAVDKLRRSFENRHAMHAYYTTDADVDNDLFFVIGRIDRTRADERHLASTEMAIRDQLSDCKPVIVELDLDALSFVAYTDRRLPMDRTQRFRIDEFASTLPHR